MININNNIDNNGSSGDSVKGRFRDRLRLIRINRFKRYKYSFDNEEFIQDRFREINRLVNNNGVVNKGRDVVFKKSCVKKKIISLKVFNGIKNKVIKKVKDDNGDRFVRGVIRRIRETAGDRNYIRVSGKKNRDKNKNAEKNELKVKIVRKIKSDLEKKSSELEILEGELYYVKDKVIYEKDANRVRELKREIEIIRGKIDDIISSYDVYKDGYCDIDDDNVMDDIIRYRELSDSDYDYGLLDEYRYLYNRLVSVINEVDNVIESTNDKVLELEDMDYRFYNMKNQVAIMKERLDECEYKINKQNQYMDLLMKKIRDIDKVKYSTYKFNGVKNLIFNSVKYVSLLLISPLAGLIPSIAINTLVTRRMIKNVYKNMNIEKVDRVKYQAVNYDLEIKNRLNDLDFTYDMVDDTIKMIDKLKYDMVREFGDMNGVSDTLGKLDDIRDKVVGNRYKMDIVRKKLVASKKINDDKLVRIKKLNNG